MNVSIRAADLENDRKLLVSILSQNLAPGCDERSFDWRYRQNPHGQARAWLAINAETGEPIGASAAFPRLAHLNASPKRGWVLGDFCISEGYRTLGPALQLQRATLSSISETTCGDFFYDFPSRQFVAVYQRMGILPAARIIRLAKPLRVDDKFRKLKGVRKLSRPAAWLGNSILKIADLRPSKQHCIIDVHRGYCDQEFTELLKRTRDDSRFSIARSAEYLNWRYLIHPRFQHRILTARRSGELQGYLVFNTVSGNARISDWCCDSDDELLGLLVRNAIRRLRTAGATTLSVFLSEKDPRLQLFRQMGFWPRESCPFVVRWNSHGQATPDFFPMHGDRDV